MGHFTPVGYSNDGRTTLYQTLKPVSNTLDMNYETFGGGAYSGVTGSGAIFSPVIIYLCVNSFHQFLSRLGVGGVV